MAGGFVGKVLSVNLSSGGIAEGRFSEEESRLLIGGYGLGAKVLLNRQRGGIDALGPDNTLGFVTGPLTGSGVPMGNRYMVVAKSPLTGAWGGANSGGYFGLRMKAAGYDAVFFTGVSERPVYLLLNSGEAELRDASSLWGKDTYETDESLRSEFGGSKLSVACIGPAGESTSLISSIMNDKGRAAGRCGLGAVMGSKRLKAIVARGNQKVPVADTQRLHDVTNEYSRSLKSNRTPLLERLMKYGTSGTVITAVVDGTLPIKNWQLSGVEAYPEFEKVCADNLNKYKVSKYACYSCPVACGGLLNVEGGPYPVLQTKKTEYETIAAFGSMCLNSDVESIIKAGDMCNRAGLDTMSAGSSIAFAMECFDRGIITERDTGGVSPKWGDASAIVEMLRMLAERRGFGEVLADGVKVAATKIGQGAAEFAIHVHGQEMGFRHPMVQYGRALGYVVDPAPGRHTAGGAAAWVDLNVPLGPYPELGPFGARRWDYYGKGPLHVTSYDYQQVQEASGICIMAILLTASYPLVEFMSAVTGWELSCNDLLKVGGRIATLRQVFNLREGLAPRDFVLPKRLLGIPPMKDGPLAGETLDIETLVAEYFCARNWDPDTGWPSRDQVVALGLGDLLDKAEISIPA